MISLKKPDLFDSTQSTGHQSVSQLPSTDLEPLALVAQLCHSLSQQRIGYCHWKSNNALQKSATGENDLDLLIRRSDKLRFTQTLLTLGFVQVEDSPVSKMPGVLDYIGHDEESGRLVHVHAHYQLVVGQDLAKNYHLPVEEAYLSSATQSGLFRIPSVEFELIVLVIRMIIKYSTWDSIIGKLGPSSTTANKELAFLKERANMREVNLLLADHFPQISPQLFEACISALMPGESLRKRIRAGHRLQRALRHCTLRTYGTNLALTQWRRLSRAYRNHVARVRLKKKLSAGGVIIAVVGGDGSGKTTSVDLLSSWLSSEFDIKQIHLGKPSWSGTTKLVRSLLKVGRVLGICPWVEFDTIRYTNEVESTKFPGYALLIREVCAARDRYLTFIEAKRAATSGTIVISDRFPLEQITMMDGAQVFHLAGKHRSKRWVRFLHNFEQRYYRAIGEADILIVLRLDPEIALKRRPEDSAASVWMRNAEIYNTDWQSLNAHVIDASAPRAQVDAQLRSIVWSQLS